MEVEYVSFSDHAVEKCEEIGVGTWEVADFLLSDEGEDYAEVDEDFGYERYWPEREIAVNFCLYNQQLGEEQIVVKTVIEGVVPKYRYGRRIRFVETEL